MAREDLIIHNTIDGETLSVTDLTEESKSREPSARRHIPRASGSLSSEARARKAEKAVRSRSRHDPYIWGIYIMLLLVSVVELFSASSTEVRGTNIYGPLLRHVMYLGGGLAIVLWLQNLHYGYLSRFAVFFAVLSIGLLIISTFFGADINGAKRAISIMGVTIQPAEILKLAIVILLATILGRNQKPGGVSTKGIIYSATMVAISAALLWINGLTNMIILMVVSLSMFAIGGIPLKKMLSVFAVYAVILLVIMSFKSLSEKGGDEFDKVAAEQVGNVAASSDATRSIGRSETWVGRFKRHVKGVNPTDSLDDFNRQVILSNMAQANGGLIGHGPGNSRESARLPLAFSDYIFSIIVEDTGFIGGTLLLVLYLLLLGRAGAVAYRCSRALPAFLIIGCAVLIVSQALVHFAITTGVAPVSGQPLPLISKGGTSILVMSAAIGIMLSVSRFAVKSKNKKEINEELDILPADMQAANYSLDERQKNTK